MSKHTPGPWTVEKEGNDYIVYGADGLSVADVLESEIGRRDGSLEPNARLIAAAPALLDACKALAEAYDRVGGPLAVDPAVEQARAAIAIAD